MTVPAGASIVASFTVQGEPTSKARARFTGYGSHVRAYTPAKTKTAEERIAWGFRGAGGRLDPDPEVTFGVGATFYAGTRQRRDVDNMLKLVLDGLNGIAWRDDTQVVEIAATKRFTDKEKARTEVVVYRIGTLPRLQSVCVGCGVSFGTYRSHRGAVKYCSAECRQRSRAEARKRTCGTCGAVFEDTHKRKYCSPECRNQAGRVTIACAQCGAEFETVKSWGDRQYCSDDCRRARDAQTHRERRTRTFPGTCSICGAGTTRKEYRRCNPCKLAGKVAP